MGHGAAVLRSDVSVNNENALFEESGCVLRVRTVQGDQGESGPTAIGAAIAIWRVVNFLDERMPERFWSKIQPCPMSGCWIWTGASTPLGYGMIAWGPTRTSPPQYVHRVAFIARHGPLPRDSELDHRCRVTSCCNPAHLERVTHQINCLRGISPPSQNARVTHCPRGHELTEANTRLKRRGKRVGRECRFCHNERQRGAS